ncbi:hypothetical protein [Xenorhabdus thailandensis]|uniref:phage tail fiber protein n=1 Tax=Xenorhabdus thailandensis TaxID=3136255 RepID=UPI0030F39055
MSVFATRGSFQDQNVERLSEGMYLIKNVQGFNTDVAWGSVDGGIEIPLCKNKLLLIWVDYRVLPNDAIKLMTYHSEHADADLIIFLWVDLFLSESRC